MALIRTKAKQAGPPQKAVQFLGDPSVHPDIFWDTFGPTKPRWRVRTSEERGSQWIESGYWIIGRGQSLITISPGEFKAVWEIIEEDQEIVTVSSEKKRKDWPKPTLPLMFSLEQWVLHLETQGKYQITLLPDENIIKTESGAWKPAYGYKPEDGGPMCHRSQDQMEDGRFVVTNAPHHGIPMWDVI